MLNIALIQADIHWEDKPKNIEAYSHAIAALPDECDLAILPEMCTTGFSMQASLLAETNDGETIKALQSLAATCNVALAGSFIAKSDAGERYFNRGFLLTPEGEQHFYDKRHLFRMGTEQEIFTAGSKPLIVSYKGWNISLCICYDLRFPVWLRNRHNAYDLLICCANWPDSRQTVWNTLLQARAIENMSYVCGTNRVGTDGIGLNYAGGSTAFTPKGERMTVDNLHTPSAFTLTLHKAPLEKLRERFPAWKDADAFSLTED